MESFVSYRRKRLDANLIVGATHFLSGDIRFTVNTEELLKFRNVVLDGGVTAMVAPCVWDVPTFVTIFREEKAVEFRYPFDYEKSIPVEVAPGIRVFYGKYSDRVHRVEADDGLGKTIATVLSRIEFFSGPDHRRRWWQKTPWRRKTPRTKSTRDLTARLLEEFLSSK